MSPAQQFFRYRHSGSIPPSDTNNNQDLTTTRLYTQSTKGCTRVSTSGNWEADPLNHIGHPAHKATLPTQGSSENEETGNRSQMKEMEENKRLDIEFKTMVIRFLKISKKTPINLARPSRI